MVQQGSSSVPLLDGCLYLCELSDPTYSGNGETWLGERMKSILVGARATRQACATGVSLVQQLFDGSFLTAASALCLGRADEMEERLINEEYKIWKKNTPFLYGR